MIRTETTSWRQIASDDAQQKIPFQSFSNAEFEEESVPVVILYKLLATCFTNKRTEVQQQNNRRFEAIFPTI